MSSISKQQLGDITTSIIRKGVDYIEDIEKNRDYFKLFWPTRADAEREDVNEWFMQRGVEALKPEQIRLVREGYLNMRWKKRTATTEESDYKAGEKLWKKIKSVVYDMMNKIYGMDTVSIPILSPAATGIFFNHTYYFFINNLIFNFFCCEGSSSVTTRSSNSSTKSKAAASAKVVSPTSDSSSTAISPAEAKVGAVGKLLCFLFYLISFSIYLILL